MQLSLTEEQISDFITVRDIGVVGLNATLVALDSCKPTPLRLRRTAAVIRSSLGQQVDKVDAFLRVALFAHGIVRASGKTLDEVIDAISLGLEKSSLWVVNDKVPWAECELAFRQLVKCNAIRLAAKSVDLCYDYANLYRSGRILTDIRPLFSDSLAVIDGAVVTFTLRLRYESSDAEHELSIALDEEDVLKLVDQCNRALTKSRTAKNVMQNKADIGTFISGEQEDG